MAFQPGGPGFGGATRSLITNPRSRTWLFGRLQREVQKRPLLAKALPTAIGFTFGDFLTQYTRRDPSKPLLEQYRYHRSALMFMAGAVLAAPVLLVFNRWMDAHLMPQAAGTPAMEAAKFVLDQIVGCVFWQAAYLSIVPSYRQGAQQLIEDSTQKLTREVRRSRMLLVSS